MLNLYKNQIEDEGALALAAALQRGAHLARFRVLNLSWNDVTASGERVVRELVASWPHLEQLEVRFNGAKNASAA